MDTEDPLAITTTNQAKVTPPFKSHYFIYCFIPSYITTVCSEKKKPSPLLSSALIPPSFPSAPVLSHSPLKLRQPTGATKH